MKDLLVTITDKNASFGRPELTAACRGHNNKGVVLNYFVFEASKEAKSKHINKDEVEYVEIKRTQEEILEGIHGATQSKKTINLYTKQFQEWGFVDTDSYHHKYKVYFKNIQAAIDNPPPVDSPKPRGVSAKKVKDEANGTNGKNTICNHEDEMVKMRFQMVNLAYEMVKMSFEIAKLRNGQSSESASEEASSGIFDPLESIRLLESIKENICVSSDTLPSQFFSSLTQSGDTHVPNTPSSPTSTGPDTVPSSDVRDNPSIEPAHSGSSPHSTQDKQDVEQQSIQDNPSNPIAKETINGNGKEKNVGAMAIGETETTTSGGEKQKTLFEVPDSPPVMPPESMPWHAEKMVQITEAKRFFKGKQGKRFSEELQGNSKRTQRERQKKAAEKILSLGITEEQYITAYNECNNAWWNAKGSVTVEIMAANTPRGVTRVIELLDQIESRGESNVISFQDRQSRQTAATSTKPVVTARAPKSKSDQNLEEVLRVAAEIEAKALQGVM